jgi:hypothetical protein
MKNLCKAVLFVLAIPLLAPIQLGAEETGSAHAVTRDEGVDAFFGGDHEQGLDVLVPMARGGDPIAQYVLGYAYDQGLGRERNPREAAAWYLKAAEGGYVRSMTRLGEMYAVGYGVEEQSDELAYRFMFAAALNGDAEAMHFLGMFHLWGVFGSERNEQRAIGMLRMSAELGYGPSQSMLGALTMPTGAKEALFAEMEKARQTEQPSSVKSFATQAQCLGELKSWSFQAAAMNFALIVAEETEESFLAALVGSGNGVAPLGESYWQCREGELSVWH